MKRPPSKVAHNGPPTFFMYWPDCPNGPETEILYHQKPGLGIETGLLTNEGSFLLSDFEFQHSKFDIPAESV